MTETVNVHEAKTHLSRLLDKVHAGQEVTLAKAGKPVARLVPLPPYSAGRRPGGLAGTIDDAFFEPLPEEELDAWDNR